MYYARYEDGATCLLQSAVRLRKVLIEPPQGQRSGQRMLQRIFEQLLATPTVDFAFRVTLKDQRLERVFLLLSDAGRQSDLELIHRAFLHLNSISDQSVELCANSTEHNEVVSAFPDCCLRLASEVYSLNGCSLTDDFALFPLVESLFAAALSGGWDVAYQINVHRHSPAPDERRAVRKNLVRLEQERSLPGPLLEFQRSLVWRFDEANALVSEFLGCRNEPARKRFVETVSAAYAIELGQLGFREVPLQTSWENPWQPYLITGFHPALLEPLETLTMAACARTDEQIRRILNWEPPPSWEASGLANVAAVRDAPRDYLHRIEEQIARLEQDLRPRLAFTSELDELKNELKKAVAIGRAESSYAMVKARELLERVVQRVYVEQFPGQHVKPLFDMIDDLTGESVPRRIIPRHIASYLHTIRVLGNIAVHTEKPAAPRAALSESDTELSLLMLLHVVHWYFCEYKRSHE